MNFQPFPTLLFQGPREAVETPSLGVFRTQWDEVLELDWRAPEIQRGNVAFPMIRCFCVHENQRALLTETSNAPGQFSVCQPAPALVQIDVASSVSAQLRGTRCCNLFPWVVSDGPGFLSCSVRGKFVFLSAENHVLFLKHVCCYIKPSLDGLLLSSSLVTGTRP